MFFPPPPSEVAREAGRIEGRAGLCNEMAASRGACRRYAMAPPPTSSEAPCAGSPRGILIFVSHPVRPAINGRGNNKISIVFPSCHMQKTPKPVSASKKRPTSSKPPWPELGGEMSFQCAPLSVVQSSLPACRDPSSAGGEQLEIFNMQRLDQHLGELLEGWKNCGVEGLGTG